MEKDKGFHYPPKIIIMLSYVGETSTHSDCLCFWLTGFDFLYISCIKPSHGGGVHRTGMPVPEHLTLEIYVAGPVGKQSFKGSNVAY